MKYFIVVGSHRKQSQSAKVGAYIETTLKKQDPSCQITTLDLGKTPLPLWDEGVWAGEEKWKQIWGPHREQLQSSDALVVVSPEWSGMVPPALKNFFLLCSPNDIGHKPGLIVTVSAGMGGSYPVEELRVSSYKNTRICYLPDHVIVRHAEGVLNEPDGAPELSQASNMAGNSEDQYLRKRIVYTLGVLKEYSKALKGVRESGAISVKDYPNGM